MGAADQGSGLKRRIGFWLLTLYGVGVMIGAGIYVLVGAVAADAGLWAPLAFLAAGIVAAPTALSYAELSSRIPQSAGEAAWVAQATRGRALPLAVGAVIALVGIVSSAAILQGGVGYLRALIDLPAPLLTVALLAALTAAAVLGVLESLALAAVLTLIELGGLGLVAATGLVVAPAEAALEDLPSALPGLGFLGATLLAFFAYLGFEDMVNMAEEVRHPQRTMPRAILAALILTTAAYMLVSVAAVRAVPLEALSVSTRPLALVIQAGWPAGVPILTLIAVAAALNGVLAQIVMAARVLYGLGARHGGPRALGQIHPRLGTPVMATLLAAGTVLALSLSAPLAGLASASAALLLAVFVVMNGVLILLRRDSAFSTVEGFVAPAWAPWVGLTLSSAVLVFGIVLG
ncbi:MAG: APC family permease [Pseudomonadota bacterium]